MPPVALAHAEPELLSRVIDLMTKGGAGNALTISVGPAFVHFSGHRGDPQVHCEAVSNRFLPPHAQLGAGALRRMRTAGFVLIDGANFERTFQVNDVEGARDLAHLALTMFIDVYGRDIDDEVRFRSVLAGSVVAT